MIRHAEFFFADTYEIVERIRRGPILLWVGALQDQFGELNFLFFAEMAQTPQSVSVVGLC
jgi:hypothetical protein